MVEADETLANAEPQEELVPEDCEYGHCWLRVVED
jgi:hypothetical protein